MQAEQNLHNPSNNLTSSAPNRREARRINHERYTHLSSEIIIKPRLDQHPGTLQSGERSSDSNIEITSPVSSFLTIEKHLQQRPSGQTTTNSRSLRNSRHHSDTRLVHGSSTDDIRSQSVVVDSSCQRQRRATSTSPQKVV